MFTVKFKLKFLIKIGRNLLKFHVFANTIRQCDIILKPYGVSVTDILSKTDEKICQNALYTFVGIVAIQVRDFDNTKNYLLYLIVKINIKFWLLCSLLLTVQRKQFL